MTPETAAALREASHSLRTQATHAERNAQRLCEEAKAYEFKARGLWDAARVIDTALAEEAS